MLDTLTVMAYLVGHKAEIDNSLKMQVSFPEKPAVTSPLIRWKNVPPEADSLAVLIHDDQKHYYWVAYNLPPDANFLPFGASKMMMMHDEGINSFGEQNYHMPWTAQSEHHGLSVELYALNRRFTAEEPLTGEALLAKIKNSVIASTKVVL